MKKHILILTALSIMSASCYKMTDANEKLGSVDMDRITPDGVTATLTSVSWWELAYEGTDYYFSFSEDGTVISDSPLEYVSVTTTYTAAWNDFHSVLITISSSGGHLAYAGLGNTFVVTEYDSDSISIEIEVNGETTAMSLVPAVEEEVTEIRNAKAEVYVRTIFSQSDLVTGVIRNGNGEFVAHYAVDISSVPYSIRIDALDDRVLSHHEATLSFDADTLATFSSNVTIGSCTISGIAFRPSTGSGLVSGTGVSTFTVEPNTGTAAWYLGSDYATYLMSDSNGKGDACDAFWNVFKNDYWSQVEISDRDNRPLVFCPGSGGNGLYLLTYAVAEAKSDEEVTFSEQSGGGFSYMYIGSEDLLQDSITYFETNYSDILDMWTDEDGYVVVKDGDSDKIWFLSPTRNYWFMGEK